MNNASVSPRPLFPRSRFISMRDHARNTHHAIRQAKLLRYASPLKAGPGSNWRKNPGTYPNRGFELSENLQCPASAGNSRCKTLSGTRRSFGYSDTVVPNYCVR